MNFVSYRQLVADCAEFAQVLRKTYNPSCFVGVPRSGMLAATLMGLELNVPVASAYDCLGDVCGTMIRDDWSRPVRTTGGPIVFVEDSFNTGKSMIAAMRRFECANPSLGRSADNPIVLAAVYCADKPCEVYHRTVPLPRCFEWNVFHAKITEQSIFDIDGVLCADPEFREQDGDIAKHIETAEPLHLPSRACLALCTSRLRRYEKPTLDWLRRHGVRYGDLEMSPFDSAVRRNIFGTGRVKGEYYARREDARLFVESCRETSEDIFLRTKRPVLCTDTMEILK